MEEMWEKLCIKTNDENEIVKTVGVRNRYRSSAHHILLILTSRRDAFYSSPGSHRNDIGPCSTEGHLRDRTLYVFSFGRPTRKSRYSHAIMQALVRQTARRSSWLDATCQQIVKIWGRYRGEGWSRGGNPGWYSLQMTGKRQPTMAGRINQP